MQRSDDTPPFGRLEIAIVQFNEALASALDTTLPILHARTKSLITELEPETATTSLWDFKNDGTDKQWKVDDLRAFLRQIEMFVISIRVIEDTWHHELIDELNERIPRASPSDFELIGPGMAGKVDID